MFAVQCAVIKVRFPAEGAFYSIDQYRVVHHYIFGGVISIKHGDAQYFEYFAYGGFSAAYVTGYANFKHGYFFTIKSMFGGSTLIILQNGGMVTSFTGKVLYPLFFHKLRSASASKKFSSISVYLLSDVKNVTLTLSGNTFT